MTDEKKYNLETIALHAGHEPDKETHSRAVPLYQTTSYTFDSTKHAAELFGAQAFGNIYTRLMNPTTDVLEKRIAELEGGGAACAVASGQSAISLALLNIAQSGDEIVATSSLYGGAYTLLSQTFKKFGIKVTFVDSDDLDGLKATITDKTKALYTETIGNPKLDIVDIKALSEIAHNAGIPLVVDNTTLTPYLFRPFEYGADITVYSCTKFLGGHGTSIGGVIVDSTNFDWEQNDKFPLITDPDPSYHGVKFVDHFRSIGNIAYIVKIRFNLLRDLGPAIAPFNAWNILLGIETLHLRMERHSENALKVAEYLEKHPKVSWVNYPKLKSHKHFERAKEYLPKGASAIVGFGVKGDTDAGKKVIDNVELFSHLANIGDAKSLIIHPASTTHSQLSEDELKSTGVTPDYIRLSVGIENIDDIIADLDQALAKV